jgi:rare lipoprotein A
MPSAWRFLCLVCGAIGTAAAAAPHVPAQPHTHARAAAARPQVGKASIYSKRFAGRKMANGERMDPRDDNAASKTLPLGTKALVTNLRTGKQAVVTIEDRGPHVPGRIVDLSPATAEKIGLSRKEGLAPVEVRPIELPAEPKVAKE